MVSNLLRKFFSSPCDILLFCHKVAHSIEIFVCAIFSDSSILEYFWCNGKFFRIIPCVINFLFEALCLFTSRFKIFEFLIRNTFDSLIEFFLVKTHKSLNNIIDIFFCHISVVLFSVKLIKISVNEIHLFFIHRFQNSIKCLFIHR